MAIDKLKTDFLSPFLFILSKMNRKLSSVEIDDIVAAVLNSVSNRGGVRSNYNIDLEVYILDFGFFKEDVAQAFFALGAEVAFEAASAHVGVY